MVRKTRKSVTPPAYTPDTQVELATVVATVNWPPCRNCTYTKKQHKLDKCIGLGISTNYYPMSYEEWNRWKQQV